MAQERVLGKVILHDVAKYPVKFLPILDITARVIQESGLGWDQVKVEHLDKLKQGEDFGEFVRLKISMATDTFRNLETFLALASEAMGISEAQEKLGKNTNEKDQVVEEYLKQRCREILNFKNRKASSADS